MKYISIIIFVMLTGCFSTKVTSNDKPKNTTVTEVITPIDGQTLSTDTEINSLNIPGLSLGYILLGVVGCCVFCSIPSLLNHRAKKESHKKEDSDSKRIVLND